MVLSSFGSLGVGQTAAEKGIPAHTSVCEIIENPEHFEGRRVRVHGRYSVDWEWGAGIVDERCDRGIRVAFAKGYNTPGYLSKLYVEKNGAFHSFEEQERSLCSMSLLCEFDYIEVDFIGIVVGPNRFPERALENESVLVVSSIVDSKLHRKDAQIPALPSEIPDSTQR